VRLAVNAIYSVSSAAVPMVVSIVTVPLFLRVIGGDRYGALMIAWLLLGYFGQADLGIARAITQRISSLGRHPRHNAMTLWSGIVGVLLFSAVSGVLVYVASGYFFSGPLKVDSSLREEMMNSRWALALCIPSIAMTSVFAGGLMGLERFKLVSVATLVGSIFMQVFPLLTAYFFSKDMAHLIAAALAGSMLGLVLVSAGAWFTMLREHPIAASLDEFRHLFSFGMWIMLTMFISPLMTVADRFVIGATLGAAAVAVYTVPFQIASRSATFPQAISQVLFPRFASDAGDRSLDRCVSSTALIAQLYAPLVIGLACFAAPLLDLWIGKALDTRSIIIGQIVLLGFWANAIAGVPYAYIQARGNPRFTAMLHLAELPIYVGTLFFLGTRYGLAGVAIAFSLRCALDCLLLITAAKLWTPALLSRLGVPAILVLAAVMAGQAFGDWIGAFVSASVLCSAAVVSALLQMPPEVRQQLDRTPVGRFLPRRKVEIA
jgi:O-antigen/teichoic acid export membrane protein